MKPSKKPLEIVRFTQKNEQVNEDFDFYRFCGFFNINVDMALNLTPNELFRYVQGQNERIQTDYDLYVQMVYLNNVLQRTKKIPRFEQLTKKHKSNSDKKRANRQDYEALKREFERR